MTSLNDANVKTPKFSLDGKRFHAKCVKAYDADSINIVFWHNERLVRWATRLYGINAPEVTGEEKPEGIVARDWIRDMVLDKEVWVECYNFEKYGRLLCDIYLNDKFEGPTLSDMVLENGMGVPYMRTRDNPPKRQ